jgi:hypothetical protein
VSLDCPFLIATSVFFNVYLLPTVFLCLVYPMLYMSLDCPFVIATSVFSNVYLLPVVCLVSCVPNVVCVFGLSILDCHFRFL